MLTAAVTAVLLSAGSLAADQRERLSINDDWRFMKYGPNDEADQLIYDVRPEVRRKRQIILGQDNATATINLE